jgi:hypothetical protein
MPLCNRVAPTGDLVALPGRGGWMGNRGGRFHDPESRTLLGRRTSVSRRWICCRLQWRNRQRSVWGRSYTELFFSDDAAALSAGHRPCFECRREDAQSFQTAWHLAHAVRASADEMDAVLHLERQSRAASLRLDPRGHGLPQFKPSSLPEGVFQMVEGQPAILAKGRLWRWSFGTYTPLDPSDITFPVLSLPSILACQHVGYRPHLPEALLAADETR